MLADLATCAAGSDAPSGATKPDDSLPAAEEAGEQFFREQLGVFPCSEAGARAFEVDCKHFYNCAKSGSGNALKGELLKCPAGSQFDELTKKCSKGAKCDKQPLNPLLFAPSPLIADAKEAGGEFVE